MRRRETTLNQHGHTLLELLIALIVGGIVAAAGVRFYQSMNQQVVSQQELSDMLQVNRICLEEIATNLRWAGYKLTAHDPFMISGDSLEIYYRPDSTVDTIRYFLGEYDEYDSTSMAAGLPEGMEAFMLMKQINSEAAVPFADLITRLQYTPINSRTIAITLDNQTSRYDETFSVNNGYREFTNTERVVLRNVE